MAVKFARRAGLVTLVLLLCIGADLGAKAIVRETLAYTSPRYYLGGLLRLSHWENAGTIMGAGAGLSEALRFWLFTVFIGILAAGLIALVLIKPGLAPAPVTACSLIAGGALSNIIDRLLHEGRALDFINIMIAPLHMMIFNLADVEIALGVIILAGSLVWRLILRSDSQG